MLKNDISFELGIRWAEALKKRFPEKNRVKSVAGFFDVVHRRHEIAAAEFGDKSHIH